MTKNAPTTNPLNTSTGNALNVKSLIILKQKAQSRGLWFKSLNRLDRVLFDLTIKVSKSIQSSVLIKELLGVAQKLETAFESKLERITRQICFYLEKLCQYAQLWGNKTAKSWTNDKTFACYLSAMNLNRNCSTQGGLY